MTLPALPTQPADTPWPTNDWPAGTPYPEPLRRRLHEWLEQQQGGGDL